MLSGLRKGLNSTVGKVIALAALGVIALAFALTDVNMLTPGGGAPPAGVVAQVGNTTISDRNLQDRMRNALDGLRRDNPSLTMNEFVSQGGLEGVLDRMIDSLAIEMFGERSGLTISRKFVDGRIASIPAFQGFDGSFNQQQFDQMLTQQGITADQLREDIRRETMFEWLTAPVAGARQVPAQLALPYASLLLERRRGSVAFVATSDMDPGPQPTDEQLAQYYQQNRARYTVPERRTARFATMSPDSLADQARPSDEEIQQLYQQESARFAATERRTIRQVVTFDQAIANRIAQQIRSGTSIDAAASAAGLAASTASNVTRESFAAQTAPGVAQAAFDAERGALVGPVRGSGSFHVLRVESVEQVAGRTLEQVRGELTETLTQQKTAQALAAAQDRIDDGISSGATFDEVVRDLGLTARRTEPLFATGGTLGAQPDATPDPILVQVAAAAFDMEEGDQPQIIQGDRSGSFALVALEGIQPAAARPLAEIREGVASDYRIDSAKRQARARADAILRAVNGGTPIAQAAASGGPRAAVQPLDATRGELAQSQGNVPPPLSLLFGLPAGGARVLEANGNAGFYVVRVEEIVPGDASGNAQLLAGTRQALGTIIGQEYVEQFATAVRRRIGTSRNDQALANLRNTLTGGLAD